MAPYTLPPQPAQALPSSGIFMKIAILSREPKNYSTRRLVEVAQAR
ncbi:MAG: 30S ribosomal protein S6--L-glutamate ligase, partial [Aeromonas sobria]